MIYRDILVFLNGSPDNDASPDFALSLAKPHGARLTGIDVSSAGVFESEWSERARTVRESLEAKARTSGVTSRFRIADREPAGWKDFYANYAEFLIATKPNRESSGKILPAAPKDVLTSAGVPLIVLPHGRPSKPTSQNVVIAWSPNSQATRAVHDAMPLLVRARSRNKGPHRGSQARQRPVAALPGQLQLICINFQGPQI